MTYEQTVETDSFVRAMHHSGMPLEDMVAALAIQNKRLMKRIVELAEITPRKVRVGDRCYVWHCPDHLVPEVTP